MADWYPSWREPRATAGVPRRVRLSTQPTEAADGRVPNVARLGCWPCADALPANPWSRRFDRALIATYGGLLKQPDKQEPANFRVAGRKIGTNRSGGARYISWRS